MMIVLLLVLGVAALGLVDSSTRTTPLSCRDENGQPVDWFVVYKLPGRSYVYQSSESQQDAAINNSWIESSRSIDSPDSIVALTLQPLYQFSNTTTEMDRLVLMYNDEWPNGTSSETAAHAKGVVAFDNVSGFWLSHSVPRFPPAPGSSYSFPPTGIKYGQTMLCVSLPFSQADLVGEQLLYYHPFVYHWESRVEQEIVRLAPNLLSVAQGEHVRVPPWSHSLQLVSSAGASFTSFAKASQFGLDLYGDWMAEALQTPLYVESWTNGQGGPMPSYCSNRTFTVQNVRQVQLMSKPAFPSHKDHSKWAIAAVTSETRSTTTSSFREIRSLKKDRFRQQQKQHEQQQQQQQPWVVCIGDINRMDSQRHRGGGALCIRSRGLWRSFSQAVDQVEACPLLRRTSKGQRKRKQPKRKFILTNLLDV